MTQHHSLAIVLALALIYCGTSATAESVSWWVSTEDGAAAVTQQAALAWQPVDAATPADIVLDPAKTYQSILGLGAAFEHATCYNISQLPEPARTEVIRKLVDVETGMGISLMRLCIGTSDFTGDLWYSYNDMPKGETDPELKNFSIGKDRVYVLPVVKKAQEINPGLQFFASVWSGPAWMKSNGRMTAGELLPEYYDAFSRYLVKFVQAYRQEGISVLAITPQNEPHFPNPMYPTTGYKAEQMLTLIRDHLGPRFEAELPNVELWCWDHNWSEPEFPATILRDTKAAAYVDGVAWHGYEGKPEAQTTLHQEFPDEPAYFTEGSMFMTRGAIQIIEILRNWARSYNAWVLMLDEDRKPNNGPHNASRTCIELLRDGSVRYNYDYYMYTQFMRFIRPGAVRIDSTGGGVRLNNVAFRDEAGNIICVVANAYSEPRTVRMALAGREISVPLPARSVATLVMGGEK